MGNQNTAEKLPIRDQTSPTSDQYKISDHAYIENSIYTGAQFSKLRSNHKIYNMQFRFNLWLMKSQIFLSIKNIGSSCQYKETIPSIIFFFFLIVLSSVLWISFVCLFHRFQMILLIFVLTFTVGTGFLILVIFTYVVLQKSVIRYEIILAVVSISLILPLYYSLYFIIPVGLFYAQTLGLLVFLGKYMKESVSSEATQFQKEQMQRIYIPANYIDQHYKITQKQNYYLQMLKLLRELDQFGVFFQPRILYSKDQYKTHFGGIMSILLYGLCLTYLVYLCFQWKNGEILPKITTQSVVKNDFQLSLNETYISFYLDAYNEKTIDPFKSTAMILQPALHIYFNGRQPLGPQKVNYTIQLNEFGFTEIKITNLQLTLSSLFNDEAPQIEYDLSLGRCTIYLLKEGEQCADNQTVIDFFQNQTNFLVVNQYVKEFNILSQQLEIIPRESLIPIQQNFTYYARNYLQLTQTSVDFGFLFEYWNHYSHVTNYRLEVAVINSDFFKENCQFMFSYNIDNIQLKQVITYSKISEILANAGSIASTILLFSYLIVMLNQNQMQFEAINKVISMYYPDFKDIKIKRNLFGQINHVTNNGRVVDLESFKRYYKRLTKIGEFKLTISNQIYEISRLQLLIQSLLSKEQIQQIHKKGIHFQINVEESQSLDMSMVKQRLRRNIIVPINERGSILETKSNTNNILDPSFTDRDFSLLILQEESQEQQINNIQELEILQE